MKVRNLAKLVKLLPVLKDLLGINIPENTSNELLDTHKSIVYLSTKLLKSSQSQQRCCESRFEMEISFQINELVNAEIPKDDRHYSL